MTEKTSDTDLLRKMTIALTATRLMALDLEGLTDARPASASRIVSTSANGYRDRVRGRFEDPELEEGQ